MVLFSGERQDSVGNGRMKTSFSLTEDGRLVAVTNTQTKVMLIGLTGTVTIILLDERGLSIWASNSHSFGVDGTLIGTSNRFDSWSEMVPLEILNRVRGYGILQQHNPRWRWEKIEQLLSWLNTEEGKTTLGLIAVKLPG